MDEARLERPADGRELLGRHGVLCPGRVGAIRLLDQGLRMTDEFECGCCRGGYIEITVIKISAANLAIVSQIEAN